jgi:hypothetical protein
MPGLLRMMGRTAVVAGTASAVAGRVQRRQQNRWGQQEQAEAPQQEEQAPPPPPPAPAVDPIHELKELADLKQQGVLTDDEFAVQKAKILQA